MKKILIGAIVLLGPLVPAHSGHAATISWKLPPSYADGTPMDPADVRKIVVRVYAGPSKTGPWKWVATSSPGATSVMVRDPSPGDVPWYTVTSTLNGLESRYAKPATLGNLIGRTHPGKPIPTAPIKMVKDGMAYWELPASYADGTPMEPEDVRKIVVRVYAGPAKTGPWKWVATSLPGASSVMVMNPSVGQTLWYASKLTLDGSESGYGDPVSRTNLDMPILPFLKKVKNKIFTVKKMMFLLFLFLLAGLAWLIRRKRSFESGRSGRNHRT